MKFRVSLIVGLILVGEITRTWGTISPDSKNKKKEKIVSKRGPVSKSVFDRNLIRKNVTAVDILRAHGTYFKDTKKRQFFGDVLGYITPWHGQVGYEMPKTFHGKFTMVSPVWLKISGKDMLKNPETHDFKLEWTKEMRALDDQKHSVRILPRVIFENFDDETIEELSPLNKVGTMMLAKLVKLAKEHGFDGYVLEFWNQFAYQSDSEDLEAIAEHFVTYLRNNKLEVVLAIPPKRGTRTELFSRKNFEVLEPYVTAFSLMTYDFSSIQNPGPNSPFEWIRECVEYLVPREDDPARRKILMGINFYGNHYTPQGGGAVINTEYLELLQEYRGKLKWDDDSKEHFFEIKSMEKRGYVFYPTLYSVKKRVDLARRLGIGISIWELGQGLDYFYDLL